MYHLTRRVGISTMDLASLVHGRNSDPSGEISLSCMDTHDGLLYSQFYNSFSSNLIVCLECLLYEQGL